MSKHIDLIAADLLRETASWDSIDVGVTVTQTVFLQIGKNPPQTSVSKERFIETFAGQRYYKRIVPRSHGEEVAWLGYRDGTRCAYVEFKKWPHQGEQHSITITKTFMDEQVTGYVMRPEPLRFNYVGLVPLHEAILKAPRSGSDRVAGRECDVFLLSGVPGRSGHQELVYHLDAATSIPLKVEAFANQDRFKSATPSWVWEATTVDDVQGFHIALNSRYTGFVASEEASSVKSLSEEYKIDEATFNSKHEASSFWPAYDKGTRINDLIAHKNYFNTLDKKAPPAEAGQLSRTEHPIVADEPGDLTPWISGAGFSLGATLLVAGTILWMRRR
jgi:hypothetical protein